MLAFGPRALVTLKLAKARIPAAGPLRVRIANANGFAISGKLSGKTTKRVSISRKQQIKLKAKAFAVGAHAKRTVKLKLPRALRRVLAREHKLKLRLTVKLKDPAGNTRRVHKTISPRLAKKHRR